MILSDVPVSLKDTGEGRDKGFGVTFEEGKCERETKSKLSHLFSVRT